MITVSDVDQKAIAIERKWGADRLPRLVSELLQAKFENQKGLFDEAVSSNDETKIDHYGGGMIRAWEALDQAATQEGHRALSDTIWTVKHEGTGKVIAIYNGEVNLVELREAAEGSFSLADLVKFIPDLAVSALEVFPGSKVLSVKGGDPNGEIPF